MYAQLGYNETAALLNASGNSRLINEQKGFVNDMTGSSVVGALIDGTSDKLTNEDIAARYNERVKN